MQLSFKLQEVLFIPYNIHAVSSVHRIAMLLKFDLKLTRYAALVCENENFENHRHSHK
jgi:hypothetical protein